MDSIKVTDFNLRLSLENGQFHQWTQKGKGYLLKDGSQVFYVEQQGGILLYAGVDADYLKQFLGLDQDYSSIIDAIRHDDVLDAAVAELRGMRLFKQDLWSCMIAFIISSNNNIKRIMQNVEGLCATCGTRRNVAGNDAFSFPSPEQISSADLSPIRLGYREKYIKSVALQVTPELLEEIASLPYPDAKEKLMELPGIGPKVADCICLFSLGHFEAFPIDTWINQVLDDYYFGTDLSLEQKQQFAKEYFGVHRGYAQQFLFQWGRMRA